MRFADTTGFWFGLHVRADRRHEPARALWRQDDTRLLTSNLILGETWTLARVRGVSHKAAILVRRRNQLRLDAPPTTA
jgi:predicted nucleic acid-binding protein